LTLWYQNYSSQGTVVVVCFCEI